MMQGAHAESQTADADKIEALDMQLGEMNEDSKVAALMSRVATLQQAMTEKDEAHRQELQQAQKEAQAAQKREAEGKEREMALEKDAKALQKEAHARINIVKELPSDMKKLIRDKVEAPQLEYCSGRASCQDGPPLGAVQQTTEDLGEQDGGLFASLYSLAQAATTSSTLRDPFSARRRAFLNYELVTSGSNCIRITSKSECEAAAAKLGLSDTKVSNDGQSGKSYDPSFCYFESNALKRTYRRVD